MAATAKVLSLPKASDGRVSESVWHKLDQLTVTGPGDVLGALTADAGRIKGKSVKVFFGRPAPTGEP